MWPTSAAICSERDTNLVRQLRAAARSGQVGSITRRVGLISALGAVIIVVVVGSCYGGTDGGGSDGRGAYADSNTTPHIGATIGAVVNADAVNTAYANGTSTIYSPVGEGISRNAGNSKNSCDSDGSDVSVQHGILFHFIGY